MCVLCWIRGLASCPSQVRATLHRTQKPKPLGLNHFQSNLATVRTPRQTRNQFKATAQIQQLVVLAMELGDGDFPGLHGSGI
jgi:hypothetical protein